MDPLSIFPPEVWAIIFQYINEPQDWLNLYRASSSFEAVVGGKRQLVLFPKVFPLVCKYLNGNLSEVLRLRQVCRQWRKTIDAAIGSSAGDQLLANYYEFNSDVRIFSFMEAFESHPSNPFIGRRISVDTFIDGERLTMAGWDLLLMGLLARFGSHLRALDIIGTTSEGSTWSYAILTNQIRSIALQTPNLRKLSVINANVVLAQDELLDADDDEEEEEEEEEEDGNEEGNEKEKEDGKEEEEKEEDENIPTTENERGPVLRHVKTLVFSGSKGSTTIHRIQGDVVRLCSPDSVEKVIMTRLPPELTAFVNVRTASLGISHREEMFRLKGCSSWPLSTLTLVWARDGDDEELVGVRDVFDCLHNFRQTLTAFNLSNKWLEVTEEEEDCEYRIDLPRLESLTISNVIPFAHLTNLCNLDYLRFSYSESEFGRRMDRDGFCKAVTGQVSESKIWQHLPRLKGIHSHNICFKREQGKCTGVKIIGPSPQ